MNLSGTYREPNDDASIVNLLRICRESMVNLSWACPGCQQLKNKSMKNMEFGLKWFHIGQYGVILRLDGALWLTIISGPLLTPKRAIPNQFESYLWLFVTEKVSMI